MSGEDHMHCERMVFLVSSEKLYAKKLMGCSSLSLVAVSGHGGETFTSWLSWTKFAMSVIALRRRSTKIGPLAEGFFPSWSKTHMRSFGCGTFSHAVMTLEDWKSKSCAMWDRWICGKPPSGTGVKCGIAVSEFEPFSLTMERFVSATAR